MTFEHMLDKTKQPSSEDILTFIGAPLAECWAALDQFVRETYAVEPEFRFGGSKSGWILRYRKGGRPLCEVSPRSGGFIVLVVLGKQEAEAAFEGIEALGPNVRTCLENAHAFHDGRWLWIQVQGAQDVADVQRLMLIKHKPARRKAAGAR
jgi:hypothetical protein